MVLKLIVIISLAFATGAQANCLSWVLCPYKVYTDGSAVRYVALSDVSFAPETKWQEIEVAGDGLGDGQAVVCILPTSQAKEEVDTLAVGAGCTVLERDEVQGKLVPPPGVTWDGQNSQMGHVFRNIPDPLVR